MRSTLLLLAILGCTTASETLLEPFTDTTGWMVWEKAWSGRAACKPGTNAPSGRSALFATFPGILYKELTAEQVKVSSTQGGSSGLSFWIKGDGSDYFGCIAIGPAGSKSWEQNFNNSAAYAYYFPLKDLAWHQVTVAWSDFVPEETQPGINESGGLTPAGIRVIRLGNRWALYHGINVPMPRHEFAISDISFINSIPARPAQPKLAPFSRVCDLLRTKKPVRIVTLGDSITAGHSVKPGESYGERLRDLLRSALSSDDIYVSCRAVPAARACDGRAWTQRDFAGEAPDLVTIMYGTNDSVACTPLEFSHIYNDLLNRLARATQGKTAVLLLTTIPGGGDRYHRADPFAQAVRDLATQRGLPCCDLQHAFYDLGEEKARALLPDVHPRSDGHALMATTLSDFIVQMVKDNGR